MDTLDVEYNALMDRLEAEIKSCTDKSLRKKAYNRMIEIGNRSDNVAKSNPRRGSEILVEGAREILGLLSPN